MLRLFVHNSQRQQYTLVSMWHALLYLADVCEVSMHTMLSLCMVVQVGPCCLCPISSSSLSM